MSRETFFKETCLASKGKEKKIFTPGRELLRPNEIPSISVYGENVPDAWETAVLATLSYGVQIPTEYDQDIDPESRDASLMMTVAAPLDEPRIHRSFPGGLDELEIYTCEVVGGVHDHWAGEKGWSYSYHDRLNNWPGINGWQDIESLVDREIDLPHVNQLIALTEKLAEVPHSRRAQAITWNPLEDATHHEPPCLQRVWCRVIRSEKDLYLLEMNTHWRSRDALKAAFMNIFAFTELQSLLATNISELSGRRVEPGRYVDISDSFHIYGSYIRDGSIERFLRGMAYRSFEERTWRSDDGIVRQQFEEGGRRLALEEGRINA